MQTQGARRPDSHHKGRPYGPVQVGNDHSQCSFFACSVAHQNRWSFSKRERKKKEHFGTNICSKFSYKLWHNSNVSLFHTKTKKSTHCHHNNISTSQKWSQCFRRELDIAGYVGNQGEMVTPEQCKEVDYQNLTALPPDKEKIQRHSKLLTAAAPSEHLGPLGRDIQRHRWFGRPHWSHHSLRQGWGGTYVWSFGRFWKPIW